MLLGNQTLYLVLVEIAKIAHFRLNIILLVY